MPEGSPGSSAVTMIAICSSYATRSTRQCTACSISQTQDRLKAELLFIGHFERNIEQNTAFRIAIRGMKCVVDGIYQQTQLAGTQQSK